MTTTFDDREKAFENKFKHDEEKAFKVHAKAVRAFGLWAAAEMGISGDSAAVYADSVVESDFDEPGIRDVIAKVKKDLSAKGLEKTESFLEKELNHFIEKAQAEAG